MKVLLISINAKYIHTNNAVRLLKANSSFDIDILEYTIKDDISKIIRDIEDYNPDVLGFSVYIWNVSLFIKIIDALSLEGSKLILGGPEVSYEPSYFLNRDKVDFIIKGEGELALENLLNSLDKGESISDIPNLSYKLNGKMYHNPIIEIIDLSKIKSPHFFEEDILHIPNKISYVESSRGCPYKCSYCLSSLEEKVRFFPLEAVEQTILYLMDKGSKTIKFLDRTFNANKNTMKLLEFIIKNHNGTTSFQFEITGDILDQKIIHYLNENAPKGLFRFEIGIQSINYETNYLVDRFQDTKRLFENIKLIQDKGIIDLHLDLIAGLPRENLELFIITFNEVFKLGCKELQLGFLKMLRGTKIRFEAEKYNYKYKEDSPYEIISNEDLSAMDITEIHLVEHMLEIYHNKGYFGENMFHYILNQESPYEFFKGIGNYYITNKLPFKGYQVEEVYQNGINFINSEKITYLLIQDYLLRSKIKPKIFWDNKITKENRLKVIEHLVATYKLNKNYLYKHSVIVYGIKEYFIVIYQGLKNTSYKIKENIL